MGERTSGVFLFTDLVGSTRLWEQHSKAMEAVAAAVTVQRKLVRQEWSVPGGLRIRLGIHLGTAQRRSGGLPGGRRGAAPPG